MEASAGRVNLRLPSVLDMKAAGPLQAEILSHRGEDLELDGSDVNRIGAQCLQVLLATRADWQAEGANFSIVDPSPELVGGLELLGASDLIPFSATEEAHS